MEVHDSLRIGIAASGVLDSDRDDGNPGGTPNRGPFLLTTGIPTATYLIVGMIGGYV